MISLDKCSGGCNAVDDLSTMISVPSKTKDINFKVFNMTAKINEARALVKHISCDFKCKFNSKHVIQIKNEIMKHVNVSVKIIVLTQKIVVVRMVSI